MPGSYFPQEPLLVPIGRNPKASYNTAWKIFWKNFSLNKVAQSIKEDLVQEAVTRMYELSGKVREGANGKYSVGYQYCWVAHNAMLSYLKSWQKELRHRSIEMCRKY